MNLVYILFNRPDLTARSFETIRAARPERLFLVADGPRPHVATDAERCFQARAIVENVDWPCEVVRDYSESNLGCGRRISSGITSAFRHVDRAIILEDDCIPDPSFFPYCTTLLDRYQDDERVMVIGGSNFQEGTRRGTGAYYFSKYPHCWGWATWRRSWRHFDLAMRAWPDIAKADALRAVCPEENERRYWSGIFDRVHAGEIDSWGYPWVLSCWLQNGLTALPNVNLIANVGFGPEATHTSDTSAVKRSASSLGHFAPPDFVMPHAEADTFTLRSHFGVPEQTARCSTPSLPRRILSAARRRLLKSWATERTEP